MVVTVLNLPKTQTREELQSPVHCLRRRHGWWVSSVRCQPGTAVADGSAGPAQRMAEQDGPVTVQWEGPGSLVISVGRQPCAMDSHDQVYVLVNRRW